MKEQWINIESANIYVLMSKLEKSRNSIVFLHGVGESHVSFSEEFQVLNNLNIIAIDLPGFGNTKPSLASDNRTITQAKRTLEVISKLNLSNITLVGHSWGGDIGTHVCDIDAKKDKIIDRFINIEGAIHTENMIMSKEVSEEFTKRNLNSFETWLHGKGFAKKFVMTWGIAAGIRYLASVRLSTPVVFGQIATEIMDQNKTADNDGVIDIGRMYVNLKIPKVYCWGTESLKGAKYKKLLKFLTNVKNKKFVGASHWVMMDACDEFYAFTQNFINGND